MFWLCRRPYDIIVHRLQIGSLNGDPHGDCGICQNFPKHLNSHVTSAACSGDKIMMRIHGYISEELRKVVKLSLTKDHAQKMVTMFGAVSTPKLAGRLAFAVPPRFHGLRVFSDPGTTSRDFPKLSCSGVFPIPRKDPGSSRCDSPTNPWKLHISTSLCVLQRFRSVFLYIRTS